MSLVRNLRWFVIGLITGSLVTVRALGRRPAPADLRKAALRTGADLLEVAARVVRPTRRRH